MESKTKNQKLINNSLFNNKLLIIVFFCFFQNIQAQLSVSGAKIHVEDDAILYVVDSALIKLQEESKAKVFISSDVQVSNLEALSNCVIVNHTHVSTKENTVINEVAGKKQLEKSEIPDIVYKEENFVKYDKLVFNSRSEIFNKLSDSFLKIFLPVSNYKTKEIFSLKYDETILCLVLISLSLICFIRQGFVRIKLKRVFSVRPPPYWSV